MKVKLTLMTCIAALMLIVQTASADVLILDMDPTTAPIPGFPPGPATGFESSTTVTSGSTVKMDLYLVTSTPVVFDSVGVDINWAFPGDTAIAAPFPALQTAGPLASAPAGGSSTELTTLFATTAGATLAPDGLPPFAPFSASLGGVGYYDPAVGIPPPAGHFGGVGDMPAVGSIIHLSSHEFMITGADGSFVTFTPSGMFSVGLPTPGVSADLIAWASGGAPIYDSASGVPVPTGFLGGSVLIGATVPEPGHLILLGAASLAIGLVYRRRS